MIELTDEDLQFKASAEFPDKKGGLLEAANVLEMTNDSAIKSSLDPNNRRNLIQNIASFLDWDSASNRLSDYVCGRIMIFERKRKTNQEIANWLRRLARKIELGRDDIKFKKSPNMPDKNQIELAAEALENTRREQTLNGEYASGERRSSVGVLLDFMKVNGKLWDGGTLALSENMSKAIIDRHQSDDKDEENLQIAKQELNSWLSGYIVRRIGYFDVHEHYSFKEVAQWLRLFLVSVVHEHNSV